jgi:two-component system, cell cycle sensor histidine kinase and response regulator CckA
MMWPILAVVGFLATAVLLAFACFQTHRLSEGRRVQQELEKSSQALEEERKVLELIAKGGSLKEVLDALTMAIERLAPDCFCTILLLDDDRRRLLEGSGGSLPLEYMRALDGLEIGPNVGACGTAAFRNETTIVEDVATDLRFALAKDLLLSFGLRACWSVPIRDSNQNVLGTFAMYHQRIARPREHEINLVEAGAHLAGNAIERLRFEQNLRESAKRFQLAEKAAAFGVWQIDFLLGMVTISDGFSALAGLAGRPLRLTLGQWREMIHVDDRPAWDTAVEGVVAQRAFQAEYRILLPDGSIRWLRSHAQTELSDTVLHLLTGASIDITEAKELLMRFTKAFNVNPEPIIINGFSDGRYVDVNDSFLRVTGYRREEVLGHTAREMKLWNRPEDRARYLEILEKTGSVRDLEIIFQTKAGAQRIGLVSAELIDIGGEKCAIAVIRDITERSHLEVQLRQAQKMEAVGQLTGGIAHDFNNLLGVILGYSEILETQLDPNGSLHRSAEQIRKAGQRAASLTRQLLAFSRQQVLEPRVLFLNTIVVDTEKMLRRLIGENIELRVELDPTLGRVRADHGQIEQIIVNLAVNARDAMPQGGTLIIETANFEANADYASQHPPMSAGSFVRLSVKDAGVGMDAETQAHIFEPFFTTKGPGKGTGLGLATVYGVVKQSNGFVWVHSELGRGTTFEILLPRVEASVARVEPETRSTSLSEGTETVLLVEDEESLRNLISEMLRGDGYAVLEAANAADAIEIARQAPRRIDLLLTDVVMPGMNGAELADQLVSLYPWIKTLYMSGYTEFAVPLREMIQQDRTLLQKPFTQQSLSRKVREVLENHRPVVHTTL